MLKTIFVSEGVPLLGAEWFSIVCEMSSGVPMGGK